MGSLLLSLVILGGSTPSFASQRIGHAVVDGIALVFGSSCPFGDWVPQEPTLCEDWLAALFKESDGAKQHNRTPWGLFVVRALSRVHPDGTVETLEERAGLTFDVASTFDERHLRFASATASVPMSDGSITHVDLAWDGSNAPLQTDGKNGPFFMNSGIDGHAVDRCMTRNVHYQQTYRANVGLEGSIDGTDVSDIPYMVPTDPFLGRGRFVYVEVTHGSCD